MDADPGDLPWDECLQALQDGRIDLMPDIAYSRERAKKKWLDYAITRQFRQSNSINLTNCPDCSSGSCKSIGQFIYYSTLINLKERTRCKLVFSDIRIDPRIIQTHFEQAYKDETYFLHQRTRVLKQIAQLADQSLTLNGTVLDIGGAKGHLLTMLRSRRPDLAFYLNDISREACNHAASKYGFETLEGGNIELKKVSTRFNTVIMSDALYYEQELHQLLTLLPRLVSKYGTVIIRLPNNFCMIRACQLLKYDMLRIYKMDMQDNIHFFNPEHLYVFYRQYLTNRLHKRGFSWGSQI